MSLDSAVELLEQPCLLSTADYRLAPLADGDIDELFAHFGDRRVTEYLDIEPVEARFQTWDVIDWAGAVRAAGTGLRWAIRDTGGRFIGTCGFHRLTYVLGRRGEIGYDLGVDHWGRGVMRQVLPVMLEFGFGALDLHRIEAMVTPGNERSCRLLARHGFEREGVMRDYGYWRERYWDQILFARLRGAAHGRAVGSA